MAFDETGAEIGRHTLKSAGKGLRLAVEPEKISVAPGRLVYLRLRYTDENGVTRPMHRGHIRVQVEGGQLLALGNGCPYNDHGYLSDTTDTYFGEALAIVRAGETGRVRLTATAGDAQGGAAVPIEEV